MAFAALLRGAPTALPKQSSKKQHKYEPRTIEATIENGGRVVAFIQRTYGHEEASQMLEGVARRATRGSQPSSTDGSQPRRTEDAGIIDVDDDQDSVWISVDIGDGASCHVGYYSCFYRSIPLGKIENGRNVEMNFEEKEKKFDPEEVYKGQPNPTKI